MLSGNQSLAVCPAHAACRLQAACVAFVRMGTAWADFFVVSGITQNRLTIGNRHSLRPNGGQQQMAHLLRRGNIETLLKARERLRRDFRIVSD